MSLISATSQHVPVLADECVALLSQNQGTLFIDCTVGFGGHAERLCMKIGESIKLLCIDLDSQALEHSQKRLNSWQGVRFAHGNFSDLSDLACENGFTQVDGILADMGQSSIQLDSPDRGFSHRISSPLDMRYDTSSGIRADEWINTVSKREIETAIKYLGEERNYKRIARAIVERRPIASTTELDRIIRSVSPAKFIEKTLARVFMALRMVVNNELTSLDRLLPQALELLKPGGRLVFLSYDSNQDRPVKQFFKQLERSCICPPELPKCMCSNKPAIKILTRKVVRPSEEEININPRARSAKLRAAEKL